MPHADSLALPESIRTKKELYEHVSSTLKALTEDANPLSRNYLTVLANASSLLFGTYENAEQFWGRQDGRRVNWTGFYLLPSVLPLPASSISAINDDALLLGPFHGRPACQSIGLKRKTPGVCATSFLDRKAVVVPDVEAFPGHIACDGQTKSEVVLPLWANRAGQRTVIGVLDLDCEALNGFDDDDRQGLESVVELLEQLIDWP